MEERKYNNIGREELEAVLTKAGVFKGWNEQPENDISRIAHCEALGQKFDIEWWINQCYLVIGNMRMLFHWVRIDTTWPWYEYQRELHFENSLNLAGNPAIVAVLGIEYREAYLDEHPELKEKKNDEYYELSDCARAQILPEN